MVIRWWRDAIAEDGGGWFIMEGFSGGEGGDGLLCGFDGCWERGAAVVCFLRVRGGWRLDCVLGSVKGGGGRFGLER